MAGFGRDTRVDYDDDAADAADAAGVDEQTDQGKPANSAADLAASTGPGKTPKRIKRSKTPEPKAPEFIAGDTTDGLTGDDLVIPASNKSGKSVRAAFWHWPEHGRSVDVIVHHPKTPWKTPSDFYRFATVKTLLWINTQNITDLHTNIQQLELLRKAHRDQVLLQEARDAVLDIVEDVHLCIKQGYADQAQAMLQTAIMALREMRDGLMRSGAASDLIRQCGHFMTPEQINLIRPLLPAPGEQGTGGVLPYKHRGIT